MQPESALREGLVIGMPTDTVYGLAVSALDESAVRQLAAVKGRDASKPLAVLVADRAQAERLVVVNDDAASLMERHWPGALTIVLHRLASTPTWLGDSTRNTLGVRCPDSDVVRDLCRAVGPIVATSANLSGQPPVADHLEAEAVFGEAVSAYIQGSAGRANASTVVDMTVEPPATLRPGPVEI